MNHLQGDLLFSGIAAPKCGHPGLLQGCLVCRYSKGLVELRRTVQAQVFPSLQGLQCWALTSWDLEGGLASPPAWPAHQWHWKSQVGIAARGSGRWGEAKVELWHGLFSMIHVGSSMPCHKASGNTIPTNVPLWFSEFQSLLPAAVEEQLVPAKLVLGGGYWCKHLRQYNKMDLKRRGGCFCLTSAQFLLTGKQAFVSHGRIILNC